MDNKTVASTRSSQSNDASGFEFSSESGRIKPDNMKGQEMTGDEVTQEDLSETFHPGSSRMIRWISTKDAASMLGVTLRTLYRFIDDGELPAYKLGRVIRLQENDIYAFIESARITPGELEHLHPEPSTQNKGKKARGRPSSREGRDVEVPAVS
jgi:excisionase family DNA binding protein